MKKYSEQMQAITDGYIKAGEVWPASTREIAGWAIRNGRWEPQRSSIVDLCARQLARAMREEYVMDAQGRRVRSKHAARMSTHGKQITLWADIRTASRDHMEIAFQQRRQQVVGDCAQLKLDVDSYNENRTPTKQIEMVFDFTQDLAEIEALADRAQSSKGLRISMGTVSRGTGFAASTTRQVVPAEQGRAAR